MNKFEIGQKVVVTSICDEIGDEAYVGQIGTVIRIDTGEGAGPQVGESKDDPFYHVKMNNGQTDGFWTEELSLVE